MSAGRDSCQAILDAARAEFDAVGFAGARVQRIADAAAVNKQLIFYYHGSKLGLFRSVIRSSLKEVAAALAAQDAGPHATARLRRQVAALHAALADRPHLAKLLIGDGTTDREGLALANAVVGTIVEDFATIITDGQRLGYFRDDCDATSSARHALSLVLGHLALTRASPAEPFDRGQVLDGISRVLLRSLEW